MALATEDGRVIAFARSGAGNYEVVGYSGMLEALQDGLQQLEDALKVSRTTFAGAGFGVAGYDWPSDEKPLRSVIERLNLSCRYAMVNDALPPLLATARGAWGVSLVSGTGCNCRGWDQERREGAVTGFGTLAGEGAGASELVHKAMQHVAYEWTKRGPQTELSPAFVRYAQAQDLADLLEGYCKGRYPIGAAAAPLVFAAARQGDAVARQVVRWAGMELGELANAVIRQLAIEALEFDVVLSGSMFGGGPLLTAPLWEKVSRLAPLARKVMMQAPPVAGAVLLGMEQAGIPGSEKLRRAVRESTVNQR